MTGVQTCALPICDESFHNVPELEHVDLIDVAYDAFAIARAEDMAADEHREFMFENMAPVMEEG